MKRISRSRNQMYCITRNRERRFGKSCWLVSREFNINYHNRLYINGSYHLFSFLAQDLLGEDGIFIYPTFRRPAIFPELSICETLNTTYCAIFNTFGFPAVHVPMGLNHKGLPIGVQVSQPDDPLFLSRAIQKFETCE